MADVSATNSGNTYSGAGGTAKGGSIKDSEHAGVLSLLGGDGALLDTFSKNGGHGGVANSGSTWSQISRGGDRDWSHSGSHDHDTSNLVNSGNSYSGAGGNTDGGDIEGSGALINLFSDNAGDGGSAKSGNSHASISV
ncbi:hypothetical protein AN958_01122 [Leucoagaricus sp. SymC.cos]|nr:hypothetical protein AN958_01122 [Leucoagaricus sp. SymC.cos]